MDNTYSIRVMNWNSRSIRNKEGEFFEFIEKHEIDVAVVTETWLQPNISIYHPNYSCVRLDRPSHVANRGGGVAIFVRNGIAFKQADGLNTSSIEAVEIVLIRVDCCAYHRSILPWIFESRDP